MNIDWQIHGHKAVKSILGRQLGERKFPHAYLFLGPEGVGKKSLALELAGKILETDRLAAHPDFHLLDVSESLPIEELRDFMGKLGFKPFAGSKKVAVIDNAQNLSQQSSNALLKTLEEPSPSTILILVSATRLLPTTMSRCLVLNFSGMSENLLSEYARGKGLKADKKTLGLSFGRISRLHRLLEDKDFFEQQEKWVDTYFKIRGSPAAEKLLSIGELAETENLGDMLTVWQDWQARNLKENPGEFTVLKALGEALGQLSTNKNKKMILQGLFLKI